MAAEIKAKHPKVPEVRTFVLDFASEELAAGVEALDGVGTGGVLGQGAACQQVEQLGSDRHDRTLTATGE